eukprot:1734848-Amphidinium_carterae.1
MSASAAPSWHLSSRSSAAAADHNVRKRGLSVQLQNAARSTNWQSAWLLLQAADEIGVGLVGYKEALAECVQQAIRGDNIQVLEQHLSRAA